MTRFSDLPEDLTSRRSRVQHFIAGNLIRPTSRKTGEQRLRIYPDAWYGSNPIDATQMIEADAAHQKERQRLPGLKATMSAINDDWDERINYALREGHVSEYEALRKREEIKKDYIEPIQKDVDRLTNETTLYTPRHLTLAALLGKKAVSWALSDENPSSYQDADVREYTEENEPNMVIWKRDVGESRAKHHAATTELSMGERIKERVLPWHVNVHQMTRGYGGHEEGGWWYDKGEAYGHTRGYMTNRAARRAEAKLKKHFPKNSNTSILSVSPSDAYEADKDQGVFEPVEYTDYGARALGMPSRFIQEPSDEDFDYSMFGRPSGNFRTSISRGTIGDYPKQKPHYE